MKVLLFVSLVSVSSMAVAADWKVIAETASCPEKVQILAKEGEKYLIATHKDKQRKLYSQDVSAWSAEQLSGTEFRSDSTKEKYLLGEPTFTYHQPGYVEGNPPKLDVYYSGRKERCSMNLK